MLENSQGLRWLPWQPVPAGAEGQWCVVEAAGDVDPALAVVTLAFPLADGPDHLIYLDNARPMPGGGFKWTGFGHLPSEAPRLRVGIVHQNREAATSLTVSLRPVGRAGAALWLLWRNRRMLAGRLLKGDASWVKDWRSTLVRLALHAELPDYGRWWRFFDDWRPDDIPTLPSPPRLAALVFHRDAPAALAATLESIAAQADPLPHAVAGPDWRAALAGLDADYILLLQAGEVLPGHATRRLAQQLVEAGMPAIAGADEDELDETGDRLNPHFKPVPNRPLMLSGTLTRGLWVARRALLDDPLLEGEAAETLRLGLWLRQVETEGAAPTARIPFILTRRRPDTEEAAPAALRQVAQGHLDRAGLPWRVEAGMPMRLHRAPDAPCPRVSLLVASALRAPHVERCLKAVLRDSTYPDLEIIIGIGQPGPLDEAQKAMARTLEADPRLRVVLVPMAQFNYSTVNNRMAEMADGPVLCLLNDDVSPITPDWVEAMVAYLADPMVAIVGPRLLYPDGTVQHGGVLMGMDGLCNHLNRYLPQDDPGYRHRAVLPQALSAVTGACLMVRRGVFDEVGGLDEGYPSAFNDVDFCLKVREAGYDLVYDGATSLHHFEGKTFVNHYSGERLAFRERELARMRRRWATVIAEDPFHNPNLRQETEAEWLPAFPPRLPPP